MTNRFKGLHLIECLKNCPDTKGAMVDTFLRLTYSVVLWGGRDAASE